MMRSLVSASLHLRVAVLAASFLLMAVGLNVVRRAPLDVFPEFAPPLVEIQTEAPGLSTTEVESLVSTPIENRVTDAGTATSTLTTMSYCDQSTDSGATANRLCP